jgi:phosphoadenosine phosphosulfate reductase
MMNMALWKNGAFVGDTWRTIAEGEDIPPAGHVIVPLDWWLQEREAFKDSNAPFGVRVEPGVDIEAYAGDLNRFAVIALAFPKFNDGRAFSTARLLRQRFGYRGELRAVGDVLADQMQMMERCGIDAFDISDPMTERLLRERGAPAYSRFYQPGDGAESAADTRPWARRLA